MKLSHTSPASNLQAVLKFLCRLLRERVRGEVDPMLCSCGTEMKIVSTITDALVVDRILRHLASERCKARDPFEPRAPPQAVALSRQ